MDVPRTKQAGWIEVITGSMFSGKSEELIRRLRRAQIARQKVQIFKPTIDNRYGDDHIVSHSDMRIASSNVANSKALLAEVDDDAEVVGIDEGQFFDADLPAVCNALANRGKRVIVAGLDQDYLGKPFEPMPQLLAIAEYITKTLAICMVCGNPANHTQRLVASSDRVLVGAQGTYEARCRRCFDPVAARSAPDAGLTGRRAMARACCSCSASGSWPPTCSASRSRSLYWQRRRTALLDLACGAARRSSACSWASAWCSGAPVRLQPAAPARRRGPGVRRGHDVRLLRLRRPAVGADRARLLPRRRLERRAGSSATGGSAA